MPSLATAARPSGPPVATLWLAHALRVVAGLLMSIACAQAAGPFGASADGPIATGAIDAESFGRLMLPYLDAAHNLARYLSRDPDAAQDIVQEAFLRAFRRFGTFRGGNPRAWLLAIVRNCHYDWRAERNRAPIVTGVFGRGAEADEDEPEIPEPVSEEDTPEAALLRRNEAAAVRTVLETMPEPMREVLVLRELEDCSYREIAEIAQVPVGTVMSRLARARGQFGQIWRRRHDAPEDAA